MKLVLCTPYWQQIGTQYHVIKIGEQVLFFLVVGFFAYNY
jgi:hypothetical protein